MPTDADGIGEARPSWAFDLGFATNIHSSVNRPSVLAVSSEVPCPYLACGKTNTKIRLVEDAQLLVAAGGIIDRIRAVSGTCPERRNTPSFEDHSRTSKSQRNKQ
jgi:hypothetical protein